MSEIFVPGVTKDEADYLELRRLGTKLGVPVTEMFLKVEYTPPEGGTEVVYDGRSRTYVRNFWNVLFGANTPGFAGSASYCGDGRLEISTSSSIQAASAASGVNAEGIAKIDDTTAAAGVTASGIVVGSGLKAEAFDLNALGCQILHGSVADTLAYAGQVTSAPSYNSGTNTWSISASRIFNNNSGSTITVSETAIYGGMSIQNVSGIAISDRIMYCRDLLGAPIAVANAGQLTVTYSWSLTYPSVTPTSPFSQVQLILGNENGTNASTTFADQSSYARSITTIGTAPTWSNTTAPTGVTTVPKFIGTGGLQIGTDTSALELADADFELSFLYYSTIGTYSHTAGETIIAKRAGSAAFGPLQVVFYDYYNIYLQMSSNGTSANLLNAPLLSAPNASTWYFVSIVRAGGRIYARSTTLAGVVNTTINSTLTVVSNKNPIDNTSPWTVGCNADGSGPLQDTTYVSNLRLTIGAARKSGANTLAVGYSTNDPNTCPTSWTLPLSATL
jgi:hypothetical protein